MMKLFTVGPVEMYPEILEIGSHQIPYFRNQYFSDIMYELDSNLKKLMNMAEDDKNIILTASGTGAMEAVVINCLTSEDKALVISGVVLGNVLNSCVNFMIFHMIPCVSSLGKVFQRICWISMNRKDIRLCL